MKIATHRFAVFSHIQDEIVLDLSIKKATIYKLLLHYRNPNEVPIEVEFRFVPVFTLTTG